MPASAAAYCQERLGRLKPGRLGVVVGMVSMLINRNSCPLSLFLASPKLEQHESFWYNQARSALHLYWIELHYFAYIPR